MSVLYREHFQFTADPFSITPDTTFFYGGAQRADILEALAVSVTHDEGIVMVVGEVGMGKTMLSRMLLDRLKAAQMDTVYLPNPVFDRNEILDAILRDLTGAPPQGSRIRVLSMLEPLLIERHAQGRRVVVVIDEAHAMPGATLEEIRLLSNLETAHHKLLKIVMFGQPELEQVLRATHLRQVHDRVSHRFVLRPLNTAEVAAYLEFRLQRAGHNRAPLFAPEAAELLAQASGGRTRRINLLADKALLAAFADGSEQVLARHVRHACDDTLEAPALASAPAAPAVPTTPVMRARRLGVGWIMALLTVVGLGAGWWIGQHGLPLLQTIAAGDAQPATEAVQGVAPPPPGGVDASPGAAELQTQQGSAEPAAEATGVAGATATGAADVSPPAGASQPQAGVTNPSAAQPALVAAPAPASSVAPAPAATATPTPAIAVANPVAAQTPALEQRVQETERIIAARPNAYTVQVMAIVAPQPQRLELLVQDADRLLAGALPVLVNHRIYRGQAHHAIYVGVFETREQAQSALTSLPAGLKEHNPLIRSFDRLAQEPRPQ